MLSRTSTVPTVPQGIIDFLESEGGHILLLKGAPGTGKTKFVLNILKEISHKESTFYLSTSTIEISMYSEFPWLMRKRRRESVIDASKTFLSSMSTLSKEQVPSLDEKLNVAKRFLRTVYPRSKAENADSKLLSQLLELFDMPEIKNIYKGVLERLPEKTFVIIDSIDELVERSKGGAEELLNTLQKTLVGITNTNLAVVTEHPKDDKLDPLVDGIITFSWDRIEGRRVRTLEIKKLGDVEIEQVKIIYTLDEGKFQGLNPFKAPEIGRKRKWVPIKDNDHFSTGSRDLDEVIDGYSRGSFALIESERFSKHIVNAVLKNFVSQGRPCICHFDPASISQNAEYLDKEDFSKLVRIVPAEEKGHEEIFSLVKEAGIKLKDKAPCLFIITCDEYNEKEISELINLGNGEKNLVLGVTDKATQLKRIADTHLKVIEVENAVILLGEKPTTLPYHFYIDGSKGYPMIKLTPIV